MDKQEHELITLLRGIKDPDYQWEMIELVRGILTGEVDADEVLHQSAN